LQDYTGIYATFPDPEGATRAFAFVEQKHKAIAIINGRGASLKKHRALPPLDTTSSTAPAETTPADSHPQEPQPSDQELVDAAKALIINQLKFMLERDIMDHVLNREVEALFNEREKKRREETGNVDVIKSLSFKKPKKGGKEKGKKGAATKARRDGEEEGDDGRRRREEGKENENEEEVVRPKKKLKKDVKRRKTVIEDVESEEEDEQAVGRVAEEEVSARKRGTEEVESEMEEEERPVKKKAKVEVVETKRKKEKGRKKGKKEVAEEGLDEEEGRELDVVPSRSVSPAPSTKAVTPPPTPPPNLIELGLADDDEDLYFAKLALSGVDATESEEEAEEEEEESPTSYRKHETGSARTEGFYKIDHKDKAAYVAQYQTKGKISDVNPVPVPVEEAQQHVTSSRSNRANARRRAAGLEEINQVQRAVALSKGETAASELTFKFNQLQTRKKHLRFSRSPIHDWGLYALEKISRGEMVIEYVGEVIRAQVAEKREQTYERQGIGSSYLFRIDEELVVDATKKGNLGLVVFCTAWAISC